MRMNNIAGVSRWDNAADKLKYWMDTDNYFEKFVKKVRIRPDWTVLDIGCGPGDISIWAAKRAKQVTSLDHSGRMLDFLKAKMHTEGLDNISCIQCSWDDEKADELDVHDVVIASRSVGSLLNNKEILYKIDRHAGRYVYLTIPVETRMPAQQSISKIIGNRYRKSTDFIFIYNQLYRMGIRANVEFIYARNKFTDTNDVLERYRWGAGELTPIQENDILTLLAKTLVKQKDGSLSFPYDDLCWALIRWQKTGNSKKHYRKK
jgi:SAM-dependent methyltransferase